MKNRGSVLVLIAGFILGLVLPVGMAIPSQAIAPTVALTSGNYVRNAVQPSNYAIAISTTRPYAFGYNIWPYQTSGNAQCFKPALTSHSYWGGVYWGGSVYCFQSNGNGTLTLYSGLP